MTHLWATLLTSYATASENPLPAEIPVYYLPDDCKQVAFSGFHHATIVSQTSERYKANLNCRVTISVRGKYNIRVSFSQMDLTEPLTNGCQDSVQVFNTIGSRDFALSPMLCGSRVPSTVYLSNSSSIAIVFRTDSFQERKGFKFQYNRVPATNTNTNQNSVRSLPSTFLGASASSAGIVSYTTVSLVTCILTSLWLTRHH